MQILDKLGMINITNLLKKKLKIFKKKPTLLRRVYLKQNANQIFA